MKIAGLLISAARQAHAAYARAWTLRWRMLAIHAAFLLAGAALLSPLTGAALQAAVALSGQPALADQDIARFALSPLGLSAALAAGGLLLASAVLEVTVMMAADLAERRAEPFGLRAAIGFAALRLPRLALFAALLIGRVLAILAPFLAVGWWIAAPLLAEADINFYLTAWPPEALRAAALLGALALVAALILMNRLSSWALGPALVAFGDSAPRAAFADSAARMAGRRLRFALTAALGGAAALALGSAILAAGGVLAQGFLLLAGDGLRGVALALSAALAVWFVANAAAACWAQGALAALVAETYRETGGRAAPRWAEAAPASLRSGRAATAGALLAIAGAVAALGAGGALMLAAGDPGDVEVIAHRGAAGARPENTLAAFEHAAAVGADWIELDVQESGDGAVVVVHDSDFMKLAGAPLKVWEATRADLAAIDVGSWFDPAYADQRTPTLAEALAVAAGRSKVLIELKHYGHAVRLEERVAAAVEAAGMTEQIAVMSLDHASAARMKALRPDWRVGLLAATAVGDLTRLPADFLAVNAGMATPRFIRRAAAAGKPVLVWTVNDALAMSRMISRGAAGLITDEPALALQVLAERAEMTAAERLLLGAADLFALPAPNRRGRDESP
jgi:glycerophosphoryl diester phosphodiesterase